ncbi:MAG: thermonuclease family protein [Verrucomicrobia bacterium]|nr:thermonuclease family protein [Verrucomicrobiota bacterium]
MFHILHKLAQVAFYGLLAGLGAVLYQQRSVLHPVVDYYQAWQIHRENPRQDRESISGQVIKVTGEYAFQMKSAQGLLFNFQLTGFEPITATNRADEAAAVLKEECKSRLTELILSNEVRVAPSFLSPLRTGLGVVYRGETNVNAVLVEAGLARPNRNYLKGLTRDELYEMFRAERKAREEKRGVWSVP